MQKKETKEWTDQKERHECGHAAMINCIHDRQRRTKTNDNSSPADGKEGRKERKKERKKEEECDLEAVVKVGRNAPELGFWVPQTRHHAFLGAKNLLSA